MSYLQEILGGYLFGAPYTPVYDGSWRARDKMRSEVDLNGDNLRISRAYLRTSDHCSVSVRVRVGVADCCIQTAGESDKMRINHATKADQWRAAPKIHILSRLAWYW